MDKRKLRELGRAELIKLKAEGRNNDAVALYKVAKQYDVADIVEHYCSSNISILMYAYKNNYLTKQEPLAVLKRIAIKQKQAQGNVYTQQEINRTAAEIRSLEEKIRAAQKAQPPKASTQREQKDVVPQTIEIVDVQAEAKIINTPVLPAEKKPKK